MTPYFFTPFPPVFGLLGSEAPVTPQRPNNIHAPFYPRVTSVFTPAQGQLDVLGGRSLQAAHAHQFFTSSTIWLPLNSKATSTEASEAAQATAENPESPSEPLVVKDVVRLHPLSHIISMSGLPESHVLTNSLRGWQGEKNIADIDILIQWLYDKSCEVNKVNTADSKNWLDIVDACLCFLASACKKYNQLKQTDGPKRITDKLIEFANDPHFHALLQRLEPEAATKLRLTAWLKKTGTAASTRMHVKAIAQQAPPSTWTYTTSEAVAPAALEPTSSKAHSVNQNPPQGEFSDYLPQPEALVIPQQSDRFDAPSYPGSRSALTPVPGHQDVPDTQHCQSAGANEGSTHPTVRPHLDSDATSANAPGAAQAPAENPEPLSGPLVVNDLVLPNPVSELISRTAIVQQAPPSTSTYTTSEAVAPAALEPNSTEAHSVNQNSYQGGISAYLPQPKALVTPQQPNNVDAQFYPRVISAITPPPRQHVPRKLRLQSAETNGGSTRAAKRRRDPEPNTANAPGQAKAPQAPPEDPRPRHVPEKRRRQSAEVSEGSAPTAKRRHLSSDVTSANVLGQAKATQALAEDIASLPERPVVNDVVLSELSKPLAEIISMDGFPAPQQIIGRLQRWRNKNITEIDILIDWLYDKSREANRENTPYSRQWLDTVMYGVLAFLARTRVLFQSTHQKPSAKRITDKLIQLADAPDFHALLLHTMNRLQKEGRNHLGITERLKEMHRGAVAQTDRTASAQHVHEEGIAMWQHPDFNGTQRGFNGGMETAQAPERTLQLPERRPDDNTPPPAALSEIFLMRTSPPVEQITSCLQQWQGQKHIDDIAQLIQWLYEKSWEAHQLNTVDAMQWLSAVTYECLAFLSLTRNQYLQTGRQDSANRISDKLIELAHTPHFHALLTWTARHLNGDGSDYLGITARLLEMGQAAPTHMDATAIEQQANTSTSANPTSELVVPPVLEGDSREAYSVNQNAYHEGFSDANTYFEEGNAYNPDGTLTENAHDANQGPYQDEFSDTGANFGAGNAIHQDWALVEEDLLAGNIYLSQLSGGDYING